MGIIKVESTKNNVVTRSNKLVRAKLRMPEGATYGLTEKRFLLWVISCVEPQDKRLQTYELPLNEFAELAQIPKQNVYQMIKKICLNVMALTWEIKELDPQGKEISTMINVVYKAVHKQGAGITEVTIHEDMAPHLLNQQGNFTSLKLVDFMPLRSKHALSLYEEVKIEQWKKDVQHIDIMKLRDIFSLQETQYKEFHNFEARVLKPAVNEINNKTDINISYSKVKTGRKVTAIDFLVKAQSNNKNKVEVLASLPPEKNSTEVEKLIHYGVAPAKAKKLFKADPEQTRKALKSYENNPSQAQNPAGLLIKGIEEKWTYKEQIQANITEQSKAEKEAKIKRDVLRQNLEIEKENREKGYSKYRIEIVKNYIDSLSPTEEKNLWKERENMFGADLFGKVTAKKGKERWTSAMNMHQNIEFLETKVDLGIVDKDTFIEKIYKKKAH